MGAIVAVRPATSDDIAFIFSTWLHNFKSGSLFAKRIPYAVFFQNHHRVLERILARPEVQSLVACPSDSPDTIVGYLIHEGNVVHYVYVKGAFRKLGVARALAVAAKLDLEKVVCSHWTFAADDLAMKGKLLYNPYLMFNQRGENHERSESNESVSEDGGEAT